MDDLPRYVQACVEFDENMDKLVNNTTSQILTELGLNAETYQRSFDYHVKEVGNNAFLDEASGLEEYHIPLSEVLDLC